ncbi:hypothetical protein [Staphylococcus pragensis]|uniref:hypothetical protein n=2 Tax=Staphylococcus TaxID=1279 RepID=UPI00166BB986|nr:hypothetical protein [Staphylococcus pragensis]
MKAVQKIMMYIFSIWIKEARLMLIFSIILLLIGIALIATSRFVAYKRDIDLREKIYIPGVLIFLIGALCLIGSWVN